jgi:hypothetical protein
LIRQPAAVLSVPKTALPSILTVLLLVGAAGGVVRKAALKLHD